MRIAEKPADQMTHFGPARLLACDYRPINVCATVFGVLQISLFLKDADRGENRVVSQVVVSGELIEDLLHCRRFLTPHDVHDPQLGFGQGFRRFTRHPSPLFD